MVFLKYFFEKADFENNQQLEKFSGARVNTITGQPRYLKVQGIAKILRVIRSST